MMAHRIPTELRRCVLLLLSGCASSAPLTEAPGPVEAPVSAPVPWSREPPPPPLDLGPEVAEVVPKVRRFSLPNGLRVIAESRRNLPIVSLRLVFGRGHTSDPNGMEGATYFAVTLLGDFHEETADGDVIHGEKSLRRQIWERGGSFGTFVLADNAGLALEGYAADLPEYLRILAGAVMDPRRGEETFIQRRDGMIHELEELSMSDDLGFASILRQMAFGVDHPYGRFAFGTVKTLKGLDLQEIIRHQRRLLNPGTSTLVVVGDFAPDTLERWVFGQFGGWKSRGPRLEAMPKLPPPPKKRRHILIPQPGAETMGICATLPLVGRSNPTLEVLIDILGGNFQSRLGEALRADHGLAYSFYAGVTEQRRADALLSCTRVPSERTEFALRLFTKVLGDLALTPPTEMELSRAKASLRARLLARHEDIRSSTEAWLDELNVGERPPLPQSLAALNAINAAEIQTLAQSLDLAHSMRFVLAGDERTARNAAKAHGLLPLTTVKESL